MKRSKLTILLIIALVIVAIVTWSVNNKAKKFAQQEQKAVIVEYFNDSSSLVASFNNVEGTVSFILPELGDDEVVLKSAVSASGSRYVSEDGSIVFWEHQGELTITKDDEVIFFAYYNTDENKSDLEENDDLVPVVEEGHPLLATWSWEKAVEFDGTVFGPQAQDKFSLSFTTTMANGTTDCNGFFGSYSVEGENGLSFGPLASTMMFCEGSQEAIFTSYLSGAKTYEINSDNLIIGLENGGELFFKK